MGAASICSLSCEVGSIDSKESDSVGNVVLRTPTPLSESKNAKNPSKALRSLYRRFKNFLRVLGHSRD